MSNKRSLKSFIRYDGSGRAVSSSLIWRKNKPKVGNWKEVQGYECCNPGGGTTRLASLVFNPSSKEWGIDCLSTNLFINFGYGGTTAEQWIEHFNAYYGWMGTFSLNPENPGQVFFDIKTEILNSLCPSGTPVFYIGAA